MRGGPWTAPPGAPADLNPPSVIPEWAVVTGGSCGARPPSCSVVRVAPARRCGFAGAGPASVPLTASPSLLGGGGVPPTLGGRRAAPVGGCGGGGGVGAAPPPALGPVWEGGGEWGGPLVPWRRLLTAGGGGAAWPSWPRGPAIGWGVAPFPRPPLPRAGSSCRPSLGPLIPQTLSRGAGRPGMAVRVSGQWLAGCGAAGSPLRSLSPHSLPREVARFLASCRTVGGAWVGGPSPPPTHSYPPSGPSPAPPLVRGLGLWRRRDLLYGSRGVPAAPTYRRPGDLGPYEPCPSTPRVRIVD